ncbi:hypothetical protein ACHAXA_007829, partial [Cyclostephanos tholiformis]
LQLYSRHRAIKKLTMASRPTPPNKPYNANTLARNDDGHDGTNPNNAPESTNRIQHSMANMNLHASSPMPRPPPPPAVAAAAFVGGRPTIPSTPIRPIIPSNPVGNGAVPSLSRSAVETSTVPKPVRLTPTMTLAPPNNRSIIAQQYQPSSSAMQHQQHQYQQQIQSQQFQSTGCIQQPPPPPLQTSHFQRQQIQSMQQAVASYNQQPKPYHQLSENMPPPPPHRQSMQQPPQPIPMPPPVPSHRQPVSHQLTAQNITSEFIMHHQLNSSVYSKSMQQQYSHAPPPPRPLPPPPPIQTTQTAPQSNYPRPTPLPTPTLLQQPQQQQQQFSPQHPPKQHPIHPPSQQHQHSLPSGHRTAPIESKDVIDPVQIPRIPLFTRPLHAPAAIYPITPLGAIPHPAPPPSDSRYVCDADGRAIVSPRIMRSTVHAFPADGATLRKCGDLPLALVVAPLAGLTTLCGRRDVKSDGGGDGNVANVSDFNANALSQWNGREQGEIYGEPVGSAATTEGLDYIVLPSASSSDDGDDPECIPVLRGNGINKPSSRVAITPPRCRRCSAYLNPFCKPINSSSFFQSDTFYNCPMCGASASIKLSEEDITNGTFDAATRCGTVEYEVDGHYCVRKEGPVQNVHLYGVEYVPASPWQNAENNHHQSVNSYGWYEALHAIREVAQALSTTAPHRAKVKIGLFAFCQDMLVFPYLKRRNQKRDSGGVEELSVSIVSDVTDDPFCPLPLDLWTHDVGQGLESMEWKRFTRILDSFADVMELLLRESPSSSLTGNNATYHHRQRQDLLSRNCGGAALVALAHALHDSGGRATLITTRRPNHGVGALADREGNGVGPAARQLRQQSPYRNATDEQRLFTPLQRLVRSTGSGSNIDDELRSGEFYRHLGERCVRQRICVDIVVTQSMVIIPPHTQPGPEAIHANVREFLDVPTLAELCRATCGRFKWLRVGNECGVAVSKRQTGDTFAAEQLREELKRSALAYAGNDAVFKVRCSNGVQVKSYCPTLPSGTLVGDGIVDSAELELSSIHSGVSIAVLLEHKIGGVQDTRRWGGLPEGGIDAPPVVFFQSALLYTTLTGQRRVRVSTMGLVTTKVPADVFRSADLGTVAAIMTRQAISDLEDTSVGLHNARSNLFDKTVSILANYRVNTTAKSSSSGQLILPETLQLLPLFCLSLRKSRLLRYSLTGAPNKRPFPNADERAYHIFYGRMVSPYMSLQCVHSNLFQVSDMRTLDGEWRKPPILEPNKNAGKKAIAASMRPTCQLPKSINPSISCLDDKGIYILDDRFAFYLFIGKDVPEEMWQELLSVSTPSGSHRVGGEWVKNVPMGALALAPSEPGHKLRNILHQLRMLNLPNDTIAMNARHTYAPIILVFVGRGSIFEEEMDSLLVDDSDGNEKSYVDFLVDIHRAVLQKQAQ